MGELELDEALGTLVLSAEIILYGNSASDQLATAVASDIMQHWNQPQASVLIKDKWYKLQFKITGKYASSLKPLDIYQNTDPVKNFFRIESYASGNISFVDGINSNTGYFKLDNLLDNSTTAAHEFGHTIGLEHPHILDLRGKGVPGIMYPRGTVTDPEFQYDPSAIPLQPGGTMNPFTRKVLIADIEDLRLHEINFDENNKAVLGDFTSVWHDAHLP